jgi:hypothetical protein
MANEDNRDEYGGKINRHKNCPIEKLDLKK